MPGLSGRRHSLSNPSSCRLSFLRKREGEAPSEPRRVASRARWRVLPRLGRSLALPLRPALPVRLDAGRNPSVRTGSTLQEIFPHYAALLARAEDLGLLNDCSRILVEAVAVAAWAGRNSSGHNRITPLTNLVQVRLLSDFRRLSCSLSERHDPVSSDLAQMHGQFSS